MNYATAVKVQAGIRLAEKVAEGQEAGVIAKKEGSVRSADSKTFEDLGIKVLLVNS